MYKNLNPSSIGISGRQSEVIELAMTYGFKGVEIDLADLVKRSQRGSFDQAARYLTSSGIRVGGFEVPIDLDDDDTAYGTRLAELPGAAQIAKRVGAPQGMLRIPPATDRLPYHEFFNVIRKRIDEVATIMAKEDVKVGLHFSAAADQGVGKQFKFVSDVESFLALFRSCTSKNVGITVDTWQWHVGGGNLDNIVSLPIDRVVSVRVADIDEETPRAKATLKNRFLPGTSKVIDNVRILAHFVGIGYSGPVTPMGQNPAAGPNMTRDAIVAAAQAALDKVCEEAGVPCQTRRPEMFAETSSAY